MLKPCLVCGVLTNHGSRCQRHAIQRPRGRRLQAIRSVYVIGHPCALCGAPAEHLDHIAPLSRGGGDHPSNWQALCSRCNLSKGDS